MGIGGFGTTWKEANTPLQLNVPHQVVNSFPDALPDGYPRTPLIASDCSSNLPHSPHKNGAIWAWAIKPHNASQVPGRLLDDATDQQWFTNSLASRGIGVTGSSETSWAVSPNSADTGDAAQEWGHGHPAEAAIHAFSCVFVAEACE